MKLHLSSAIGRNTITAYGEDFVTVNAKRFERSLVVLPERIEATWEPGPDGRLNQAGTRFLASLPVEIVLIGTGKFQRFPDATTLRPLIDAGIGYEVMDTAAACRTFNILVAEGRLVAAALSLQS